MLETKHGKCWPETDCCCRGQDTAFYRGDELNKDHLRRSLMSYVRVYATYVGGVSQVRRSFVLLIRHKFLQQALAHTSITTL